jgi:hypothetical protein
MMHMSLLIIAKLTLSSLLSFKAVVAAYIDPNTGGMLFQILAVMFGVISGALLLFSGRIKGLYYKVRRRMQSPEDEVVESDDPDDEIEA